MELVIEQKQDVFNDLDFLEYLCRVISQYILNSGIDFTRFLGVFEDRFKQFSVNSILILASQNLMISNYDSYIIIQINPDVNLPQSYTRLIDACRLLNYGTIDIQGTYIFSDTFDYVAKNINQIYLMYILEM